MDRFYSKALLRALTYLVVVFLSACGGGGGGGDGGDTSHSANEEILTGLFIDSPVQGLRYETQSQSGKTDASGLFKYVEGEEVFFYLGNLLLGSTSGQSVVTPLAITGATSSRDPRVLNMLRLLQTLDDDGDPDNGINISEFAQEQFDDGVNVNWSGDIFTDNQEITNLLQVINNSIDGNFGFIICFFKYLC